MLNVVLFSHPILFNDKSCIITNESANGQEEEIDVNVEKEF